jgi:hypothetical protein
MEKQPNAVIAAKPSKTANTAQAPMKAFKQRSEKRTLLSNGKGTRKRHWTPNSRSNWTDYIKAEKALDILQAAAHAHTIGTPLNYQADIHFECGNLNDLYAPQDAIGAWTKAMGQWLALRGVQATFIWFREHVTGTGAHVHVLLHIPPEHRKDFLKLARRNWLEIAHMSAANRAVIKMQKLGPRDYPLRQSTEKHTTYFNQLIGSLRYRLKGIDPDQALPKITGSNHPVAELLGIDTEDNEPIYGRRVSQSQNISKGARDRYAAIMGEQPSKAMSELLTRTPKLLSALANSKASRQGQANSPIFAI